jgi:drug/metabolite transporter (DMT)-like permease
MMIILAPMSFLAALPFWTWPVPGQYASLFILAALGTTGHLFLNQALKEGDTSLVSPVDFIRLVWAALIGYFAFGESPDAMTWIGGIMICASAVFVAYCEGRRAPKSGRAA